MDRALAIFGVIIVLVISGFFFFWFKKRAMEEMLVEMEQARQVELMEEKKAADAPVRVKLKSSKSPEKKEAAPMGVLKGRFLNPEGFPLPDVEVIKTQGDDLFATSQGDGRFQFEHPYGRLGFTAKKPGYVTYQGDAVIYPPETTDLGDIVLNQGGDVSGIVLDINHKPVPRAKVFLNEGAGPMAESYIDDVRRKGIEVYEAETVASYGGVFQLQGVPKGDYRVCAGKEGMYYAFSDPFEVELGQETTGVEVVLEPIKSEDMIKGMVLTPEGKGWPHARVMSEFELENSMGGDIVRTNQKGEFTLVLEKKVPHDIMAEDEKRLYSPVRQLGVYPGTLDLVLTLSPLRKIRARITANDKNPLKMFEVWVYSPTPEMDIAGEAYSNSQLDEEGCIKIIVPEDVFYLRAFSSTCAAALLGPFEWEKVEDPLEIELNRLATVNGRVEAMDGTPIKNARVSLQRIQQRGQPYFRDLMGPHRPRSLWCRTDEQGRFKIYLEHSGSFHLNAEAMGYKSAQLKDLDIQASAGMGQLLIQMEK